MRLIVERLKTAEYKYMEENKIHSDKAKVLTVCGILGLAAIGAFLMLPARTLDSHECFVSVTAREMLQEGHWVLPTLNGSMRINKTPLSYWLVAGFSKVTGTVDEFTARFPSAVFAFFSAVVLLYFVNQFLSFRIAAVSTAVWVTSLGYFRASHSARPDMALTFFVMVCFLAFYAAVVSESRREQIIYGLIFWLSLGLGMLAKGPAPLPYVFIPLFFYIAIERKWKIIPKLLPIVGTIIFLAIVLPWPLAIAQKVNWNLVIWKHEFFDRVFGEYAPGHYPIFFYFLIIFKYITPWVIFLPVALAAPFYSVWNKKQPVMKFLGISFIAGFIFLTVNGGKRQHYLLPLMPLVIILIGIIVEDMVFVRKSFAPKSGRSILFSQMVAVLAFVVASVIFVHLKAPVMLTRTVLFGIIAIVGIVVSILFLKKSRPAVACVAGFAGVAVWAALFYTSFWVTMDGDRYSREFAKTIVKIIPESDRLVAYKHASSRFVQYFGKAIPEIADPNELYRCYEQGDWIVCGSSNLDELNSFKHLPLRTVYSKNITTGEEKIDAGGAIFHKTAPAVGDANKSSL